MHEDGKRVEQRKKKQQLGMPLQNKKGNPKRNLTRQSIGKIQGSCQRILAPRQVIKAKEGSARRGEKGPENSS